MDILLKFPVEFRRMEYKEYTFGDPDFSRLVPTDRIPRADYSGMHASLPIYCYDVYPRYRGGILLVRRRDTLAHGELWPLGGRAERMVRGFDFLRQKVRAESGLDVDDFVLLQSGRHFYADDPFGHGKGSDTPYVAFLARKAEGELRLDSGHTEPTIVTPALYRTDFRDTLEAYVRDCLDIAMLLIG